MTLPKTQKGRRALIQSIIDRTPLDAEIIEPDAALLRALTGAPEGCRFRHCRNPMDPGAIRHLHLWLPEPFKFPGRTRAHVAGWGQWSWVKAYENQHRLETGRPLKQYDREDDLSALREAILFDVQAARTMLGAQCSTCGASENLQVDHVAPPFIEIAEGFLAAEALVLRPNPGTSDVLADDAQRTRWREWHAQRAHYQMLCRSCNSAKGARK